MREVAAEHGVVLGDVFHPTPKVFAENKGTPHTVISVHLNAAGDTAFAPILDQALFGEASLNNPSNEGLRVAIADKNFHWYHRYRIVNSYYVYGGRSGLKFADGAQTNRDQRVWTRAQDGGTCGPVDDSSGPPFLSVVTSFGLNQSKDAGAMTGQTSKTAEGESAKIARQRKR